MNYENLREARTTGSDTEYIPTRIRIPQRVIDDISCLTPRYSINGLYADMLYVGSQHIQEVPICDIHTDDWYSEREQCEYVDLDVPDKILDGIALNNPVNDDIYTELLQLALEYSDEVSMIQR